MSENKHASVGNTHRQAHASRAWAWSLAAMGAAFFLLAALATLFSSKPLQISHDTTYITGPLTPDGKRVDYFAAIEQAIRPANAATDQNGYRLLVQHLGRHVDSDLKHFLAVSRKLGLDGDAIQPDVAFQEPYDFLTAHVASEQFDKSLVEALVAESGNRAEWAIESKGPVNVLWERLGRPWTVDDLPMMSEWLDANEPALDLIGRAVRKPVFYIPMVRRSDQELLRDVRSPKIVLRARSFSRALTTRAHHRIAVGDIDGAIDDIITCKRLARHIGRSPWFIDTVAALSIEEYARAIGVAGSLEHPPTATQLRRLQEESRDLPLKFDLDQKLLFMRFMELDILQSLAHGAHTRDVGLGNQLSSPWYLRSLGIDWNIVANRFNEHFEAEHFDAQAASGAAPPPLEFSPRMIFSARARSEQLGDRLGALLIPWRKVTSEPLRRATCAQQVQDITLAMLLYERDHGTLPPAWTVDAVGKPLHSWRVLLLPYLGQQSLHDTIRLEEPWDSEHNQQFHAEDLAIYHCPSDPADQPGQTTYSVVVGPKMPFEAGEGKSLADFGPHSNDMVLLVERAQPVGWMEPAREILQSAAEQGIHGRCRRSAAVPSEGIASHHLGVACFGLRNGAATLLRETHPLVALEEFNQMLRGMHEDKYRWYF